MQTLGPKPQEFLIQSLDLGPKPRASKRVINTMLYSVSVSSFSHYFEVCPGDGEPCRKPGTGGGIERLPDGYLLSTGEGLLHYVTLDQESGALRTRLLPHRIPINTGEFIANGLENPLNIFRVTDILVQDKGRAFNLFASHLFWKTSDNCVVMRVSEAEVEYAAFLTGDTKLEWRTLYETEPCLPAWKGSISGEHGGRMVLLGDGNLLLTVGHNDFDGVNREARLSQDRSAAYGKTVLIDPQTGVSELYSLGHRNPQGLYVDRDGVIWSTEHGPRGGDELNIIRRDVNYGWPLVSHGTQYGMHTWPLSPEPGRHDGFQLPVFAWVPSIAVSNLIAVEGKLFPLWQRDLLVASFKKALYRVRIRDGRAIYLESIVIPGRIRDLLEDDDGQIVLYLDSGTIMFLRPTAKSSGAGDKGFVDEDTRGQLLFTVCSGCHELADGNSHGIGPDLAGIVGRSIANAAGYDYSPALAKRQGRWTESKLDEFLKAPQRYAPGTTMTFEGIADPADRTALIRYLKTRR
jgi:glucose/arabinose dehydrogenase